MTIPGIVFYIILLFTIFKTFKTFCQIFVEQPLFIHLACLFTSNYFECLFSGFGCSPLPISELLSQFLVSIDNYVHTTTDVTNFTHFFRCGSFLSFFQIDI